VARHEVNGVVKTFIIKANRPVLVLGRKSLVNQKKALLQVRVRILEPPAEATNLS
jgi:CO dehydrogenase/acetyl-CoA synthase epsilon subunit